MIIFMMFCIVNSRKVVDGRVATLFHFNIRHDSGNYKAHPFELFASSAVRNRSAGRKSMGRFKPGISGAIVVGREEMEGGGKIIDRHHDSEFRVERWKCGAPA